MSFPSLMMITKAGIFPTNVTYKHRERTPLYPYVKDKSIRIILRKCIFFQRDSEAELAHFYLDFFQNKGLFCFIIGNRSQNLRSKGLFSRNY